MKILFSPLGNTDPIRKCYDGACLHIVRHYHPERVVLFYTADIRAKKAIDDRYVRAIRSVAQDIEIEEIFTDIRNPHLYDEFTEAFQAAVERLHERYPDAQLLLNLSSGTPAIKTMLALLSVEHSYCLGIQVADPDRRDHSINDDEDIETAIEMNLDNEAGATCRAFEPHLKTFRYYSEKHRIESLVDSYEYAGALEVARHSSTIGPETVELIRHTLLRSQFRTAEARAVLTRYDGRSLFPFTNEPRVEELVEYFLLVQLAQNRGELSEVLLKSVPFLFTLLKHYVEQNSNIKLADICTGSRAHYRLDRGKIIATEPELWDYYNQNIKNFREGDLSFLNLYYLCDYLDYRKIARDNILNGKLLAELAKIERYRAQRNALAHTLTTLGEDEFRTEIGLSSGEFVAVLARLLQLVCGERVHSIRQIYRNLNTWIKESI